MLEAATAVLRCSEKPLRTRDVRAAVEVMLGVAVPSSSVNEALSTHAREGDLRFRRVAYGMYEYCQPRGSSSVPPVDEDLARTPVGVSIPVQRPGHGTYVGAVGAHHEDVGEA